jgi:hypothetical protein
VFFLSNPIDFQEAEELKSKRRNAARPLWRGEHDVRLTHFKTGFHICLAHHGGNFVHSLLPLGGAPSPAEAAGVKANDVVLCFNDQDVVHSSLAELCALFKAVPVGQSAKVRLMRSPAWYVPEQHLNERRELTKAIKFLVFGRLSTERAEKNAACYERLLFLDAASFEEYREEGTLRKRMRPICDAVKREALEFDRKDLEADRAALVAYRAAIQGDSYN